MVNGKNLRGFGLVILLIAAVIIAGTMTIFWKRYHASSSNKLLQSIPVQSREKAKKAGYYCPSWDAQPGEIVSNICIKIRQ